MYDDDALTGEDVSTGNDVLIEDDVLMDKLKTFKRWKVLLREDVMSEATTIATIVLTSGGDCVFGHRFQRHRLRRDGFERLARFSLFKNRKAGCAHEAAKGELLCEGALTNL